MIDNISYPGIKLLNRSNAYVENKFITNFHLKPSNKQSFLSEQEITRDKDPIKNPIVVSYKINTVTTLMKITTTSGVYTENIQSELVTNYKSIETNNAGAYL